MLKVGEENVGRESGWGKGRVEKSLSSSSSRPRGFADRWLFVRRSAKTDDITRVAASQISDLRSQPLLDP